MKTYELKESGRPIISRSIREEALSALWFIVAFLADLSGCPAWLFWCIIAKASSDHLLAIIFAIQEIRAED